jgi:thiol-disulfide isomerase/thioredoxin
MNWLQFCIPNQAPTFWGKRARSPVRKVAALVFAGVCILLLTGCSASTTSNTSDTGYISGDGSTVLVAPEERGEAISLAGETLDGTQLDIADWQGKPIVINLWASWCGPCRSEAVDLEKSYLQFKDQGIEFLGLNTRDGLAAAKAFNDRFKTSYPSIRDKDGQLTLVFGNLGPAATPSTIILDSQGRVAARILGPTTESELRVVISAVLESES